MRVWRTIVIPLWLSVTLVSVARSSFAQAPPRPPPLPVGQTTDAAHYYKEGVEAAKGAAWPEAYRSFLAAWSIKRHYQIAANLGRAELRLGKYRDAAEHLAYFLREASAVSPEERRMAQAMLDEAQAHVGTLTILVNREGAEVLVDGIAAGTAPIRYELFIEPGRRTIEAKLEGFEGDRRALDIAPGSTRKLLLMLSPSPAEQANPSDRPPVSIPKPTEPEAVGRVTTERGESAGRASVLVAGSLTATAFAAAGAGFLIAWGMADADAKRYRSELTGDSVCSARLPTSSVGRRCAVLRDSLDRRSMFGALGVAGLGVGVGAAAATLVYALASGSADHTAPASGAPVRVVPVATAQGGGVGLAGRW